MPEKIQMFHLLNKSKTTSFECYKKQPVLSPIELQAKAKSNYYRHTKSVYVYVRVSDNIASEVLKQTGQVKQLAGWIFNGMPTTNLSSKVIRGQNKREETKADDFSRFKQVVEYVGAGGTLVFRNPSRLGRIDPEDLDQWQAVLQQAQARGVTFISLSHEPNIDTRDLEHGNADLQYIEPELLTYLMVIAWYEEEERKLRSKERPQSGGRVKDGKYHQSNKTINKRRALVLKLKKDELTIPVISKRLKNNKYKHASIKTVESDIRALKELKFL